MLGFVDSPTVLLVWKVKKELKPLSSYSFHMQYVKSSSSRRSTPSWQVETVSKESSNNPISLPMFEVFELNYYNAFTDRPTLLILIDFSMKPALVEGTPNYCKFEDVNTEIQALIKRIDAEVSVESEYFYRIRYPCINAVFFFLCANSKLLQTKQSKGVIAEIQQMMPLVKKVVDKNDKGLNDMVEHLKWCENYLEEFLQELSEHKKAASLFTDKYAKSVVAEGHVELLASDGSPFLVKSSSSNKLYIIKREEYMVLGAFRLHPNKLPVNPFQQSHQKKSLSEHSERMQELLTPQTSKQSNLSQKQEPSLGAGEKKLFKTPADKLKQNKEKIQIPFTSSMIFEDKTIQEGANQSARSKSQEQLQYSVQAISPIKKRLYSEENSPVSKQLRRSLPGSQQKALPSQQKLANQHYFQQQEPSNWNEEQKLKEEPLEEDIPISKINPDSMVQKYGFLEQIVLILLIILVAVELFLPFLGELLHPFRDSSAPKMPIFVRIVDFMNR